MKRLRRREIVSLGKVEVDFRESLALVSLLSKCEWRERERERERGGFSCCCLRDIKRACVGVFLADESKLRHK